MSTFDGIICGDSDALIDQMIEAGEGLPTAGIRYCGG